MSIWEEKSINQNQNKTKTKKPEQKITSTPYSMNSLFSEFFKEFSGVILGVCDTIWRLFGGHFGGVCEGFRRENYSTSRRTNSKNYVFLLFKIALDSLFTEGSVTAVCM